MNRREQVNAVLARYSSDVRFTTAMVIDELNRIYGVRADDDVEVTGRWLRANGGHRPMASVGDEVYVFGTWSNGFYPVQCQHIRASRHAVNDDNWRITAFDREVKATTRRQFRNLCEALGVELKEVQDDS